MQIYISHSDHDREMAAKLAEELEQAGFTVWNEQLEILPGDNWAKKLGEALESSDILIALITRPTFVSESLARDVQYALTQGKRYLGRVVPVFVGLTSQSAEAEIPWILLKLHPVELQSSAEGFSKVVNRLQALQAPATHAAY